MGDLSLTLTACFVNEAVPFKASSKMDLGRVTNSKCMAVWKQTFLYNGAKIMKLSEWMQRFSKNSFCEFEREGINSFFAKS